MRKFFTVCLLALFCWHASFAQSKTITGQVLDDKSNPVSNATVSVKGKKNATTTGEDGRFSLQVPNGSNVLQISSVNYETKEVNVSSNTNPVINLRSSAYSLNEVVVVAYGTQKRTNTTGSIATVKAGDLENKPFTSVDKSLQGYVTGLQSSSGSGAPGSATDIRIRGIGSIRASQSPLWVIDGIITNTDDLSANTTTTNPLSTLNPDDIESITVLKDAASQSVYGSRAANGVILVTTKKGRAGKTKLNFSTEIGQSDFAFKPKNRAVTTSEYQTLLRESVINGGYATDNTTADAFIVDPVNGLGLEPEYAKTNTNWIDEVSRKGKQQQYNLSMTGGDEKTQFYASAGYFKQDGVTLATTFKRYNGSISVTHKLNDKFTFSTGLNGSSSDQRTPSNGGAFANPALSSFFLLPYTSPRNADGSLRYDDPQGQFPVGGGIYNPLVIAAYNKNAAQQTSLRGYVMGEYKIIKDIKFTSRYSSEYFNLFEDQYRNPFYGDGQAQDGDGFASDRKYYNWTWSNYFDLKKNINKSGDIYFNFKLGYEAQAYKDYLLQAGGQTFPKTLELQYLASAATPTTSFTLPTENTTRSVFSNGDINYKDRYVLSGSFRRDASSVFGANNRSGNFYSVGATWNVNEEAFMQKIKLINLLKIRSSYGINGNQNGFGRYTSLATFAYGQNYNGLPGSALSNVGNPDLTWEKNAIFNLGVDISMLQNRLNITVEMYNRKTTDLILNVPLSPTSGVTGQNRNVGAMTNKGYEITVGGRPVKTRDFSWDLSFNLSHNENRVTELYLGNPIPDPNGNLFNYTVGHDIYEFYTRQWAGVDPENGNPLWYTDDTKSATTSVVGQAKLALSGVSALPKYFGSVMNTFTYKGFSVEAQLYYNFGNYVFQGFSRFINSDGAFYSAYGQLTEQLESWKKPGDVSATPKLIFGGNKNSNTTSSRYLYKGDYMRLRNLQISYTLPASALKKLHLLNASIYLRGTNMITFGTDKRLPVDPETGSVSTGNFEVFIPKTLTAGVKIGFN